MTRRRYRLGKRAEAAAATRRRIVEATMGVHDRQGITRTSIRDVAVAAGVSPATVLNHFPRMHDLVRACGNLTAELFPMPTPAVLAGARDRSEAIRLAARALFEWWEAMGPGWQHLQIDRRVLADVDAWLDDIDRRHRALIEEAAGQDAEESMVALLVALTTYGSWQSLRSSGRGPTGAAADVARIFIGSTDGRAPTDRRVIH